MRKWTYAVVMAFAMGGLAPLAAHAGDDCSYGGHKVKKKDLETPAPATSTQAETKQQG